MLSLNVELGMGVHSQLLLAIVNLLHTTAPKDPSNYKIEAYNI